MRSNLHNTESLSGPPVRVPHRESGRSQSSLTDTPSRSPRTSSTGMSHGEQDRLLSVFVNHGRTLCECARRVRGSALYEKGGRTGGMPGRIGMVLRGRTTCSDGILGRGIMAGRSESAVLKVRATATFLQDLPRSGAPLGAEHAAAAYRPEVSTRSDGDGRCSAQSAYRRGG